MATEQQLAQYRRRAHRYCYDDGFVEMALGMTFLVMGLGLIIVIVVDRSYLWLAGGGLLLAVFGIGWATPRLVGELKKRITYLRTGYVETQDQKVIPRWVNIGGALSIIAVALVMPDDFNHTAIINAMGVTYILGSIAYRVGLVRLYLVMLMAIALGFALGLIDGSEIIQKTGPFVGTGLLLLLSGGITFLNYLQTNPEEVA
jgi:hypothetical protein